MAKQTHKTIHLGLRIELVKAIDAEAARQNRKRVNMIQELIRQAQAKKK